MLPALVLTAVVCHLPPPAPPKADAHGDPLPPGAVARYGTTRFNFRGGVFQLAVSPSGKHLAVNPGNNTLSVCDTRTGRSARTIITRDAICAHEYLSETVLAVATTQQLLVWEQGREAKALDPAYIPGTPLAVARSADGKRWAVSGEAGVRVFNYPACELVAGSDTDGQVRWLTFSPDGKRLLGMVSLTSARLWDADTGKRLRTWSLGVPATRLRFSPDGKKFFACGGKGVEAYHVDEDAPDAKFDTPALTDGEYVDVDLTPDGKRLRLVTTEAERHVLELDAATGARLEKFQQPDGVKVEAWAILHPDGKTVIGQRDGGLWWWDARTGEGPSVIRFGSLMRSAFTPDGKTVRTLEGADTLHEWEPNSGRPTAAAKGHNGATYWSSRLDKFLTRDGGSVIVHDARTGRVLRQLALGLADAEYAYFHQDRHDRVVVPRGAVAQFWDSTTGKRLFQVNAELNGNTTEAITRDGRGLWVATYSGQNKSFLHELATGQQRTATEFAALSVCPDPDEKHLWFSTYGDNPRLLKCDATTGLPVRTIRLPEARRWVAVSADGKRVAAYDGTNASRDPVLVFDATNGRRTHELIALDHEVQHAEFSPDGTRLVTSGNEGVAYVWDLTRPVPPGDRPTTPPGFFTAGEAVAGLRKEGWVAHAAIRWLRERPDEAVKALAVAFPPVPAVPEAKLERWVRDLNDPEYKTRLAAERQLEKIGPVAEAALRAELEKPRSEEVRETAERLLAKLTTPVVNGELLGALRAVEAAERIGTPEAVKLLEAWAAGADGATLTTEAKAALARLKAKL